MQKFDLEPVAGATDFGTSAGLVYYFTCGWCYELATYLHQEHEWPVWILTSVDRDTYLKEPVGSGCHAVVQVGPDTFLDIQGLWTADELKDEYGEYGTEFWPLELTGPALELHWSDFWQCHPFDADHDRSPEVIDALLPQFRSFGLLQMQDA